MARRTARRVLPAFALALVTAVAAACGGGTAGGNQEEDVQVGLVQINQQALFFNQMNEGARQAAEEHGVDLTIFNANDDPVRQNEAISNFVTQGYDAIIVVAIDVEGIQPAIERAAEQGVNIIAVDAIVESPAVDVQVGVDNAEAAREIGHVAMDHLSQEGIEPRFGVVGALNSFIQNVRKDSFVEVAEGEGAQILQVVDGQNQQEEALSAAENLVTSQTDMTTIYATGEPALIGAVAAVQSQNRTDDITVFGWDLSQQAISGIDAGFVEAVVQQHPEIEGQRAVEAARNLVAGEEVPSEIWVPVTIVTEDNVDEFRDLYE